MGVKGCVRMCVLIGRDIHKNITKKRQIKNDVFRSHLMLLSDVVIIRLQDDIHELRDILKKVSMIQPIYVLIGRDMKYKRRHVIPPVQFLTL